MFHLGVEGRLMNRSIWAVVERQDLGEHLENARNERVLSCHLTNVRITVLQRKHEGDVACCLITTTTQE